jgi:hypothetical protein
VKGTVGTTTRVARSLRVVATRRAPYTVDLIPICFAVLMEPFLTPEQGPELLGDNDVLRLPNAIS